MGAVFFVVVECAIFKGVLEIVCVFWMVFRGEVVVICW